MAAVFSEPSPRWGYFSAPVEKEFYVWGGVTKDFFQRRFKLSILQFIVLIQSWNPGLRIPVDIVALDCSKVHAFLQAAISICMVDLMDHIIRVPFTSWIASLGLDWFLSPSL